MKLASSLYVGIGVCAHDNKVLETANFSHVLLRQEAASAKRVLHSYLETVNIASKDRRAIYHTLDHIEAPNWSRDGRYFLFNSEAGSYRSARHRRQAGAGGYRARRALQQHPSGSRRETARSWP